jgi:hypothetical protein
VQENVIYPLIDIAADQMTLIKTGYITYRQASHVKGDGYLIGQRLHIAEMIVACQVLVQKGMHGRDLRLPDLRKTTAIPVNGRTIVCQGRKGSTHSQSPNSSTNHHKITGISASGDGDYHYEGQKA